MVTTAAVNKRELEYRIIILYSPVQYMFRCVCLMEVPCVACLRLFACGVLIYTGPETVGEIPRSACSPLMHLMRLVDCCCLALICTHIVHIIAIYVINYNVLILLCLFSYKYKTMCVYTYMCIHTCMYIYIYTYIHIHICIYTYT